MVERRKCERQKSCTKGKEGMCKKFCLILTQVICRAQTKIFRRYLICFHIKD